LLEVDRRWESRGLGGLEPVEALLLRPVSEPLASDPEWLWRRTRLLVVKGEITETRPRVALERYGEARALGIACLDQLPAFKQLRQEENIHVAASVISDRHMGCAAWTAMAWARWIALFGGDAGAIDLDDVEGLASHVASRGGATWRPLALWAQAVAFASRPAWRGADPDQAKSLMRRVVKMGPTERLRQWDLLRLVALPQGDEELANELIESLRRATPVTPEDRAATLMVASLVESDATE